MDTGILIGRLLRASSGDFVAGCRVDQLGAISLGSLVRAPVDDELQVLGLVSNIRIEDDGFVRQLVTAPTVSQEVIADNRIRRVVPVELSVRVVGHRMRNAYSHLLPPRPAVSLEVLYLCTDQELAAFTDSPRFAYLRHFQGITDLNVPEVLTAHIRQARLAHSNASAWVEAAVKAIVTEFRNDYALLMSLLTALREIDASPA
jgi:hypothetical protein